MKHNPYLIHAGSPADLALRLHHSGLEPAAARHLAQKAEALVLHLERVSAQALPVLAQTLQEQGGEVAPIPAVPGEEGVRVLIAANRESLQHALATLAQKPGACAELAEEIAACLAQKERLAARKHLICRDHLLPIGERTLVMGIVNVTPDSFSDGGRFFGVEQALAHARALVEAGADILDIGGESTRPGAEPVGLEEELDRVLPVIRALAAECPVPLSVDTYKAEVAEQAIAAGAHIINDVWGAKREPRIAEVAAKWDVPLILMHNREAADYTDFFSDMIRDLRESVSIARKAGLSEEKIILDPGIGFAKTLDQQLEVMRRLDDLVALGYPVLLGTSRKSMIGRVLDLPVDQRLEGTAATVALGIVKGCHIMRVHDVKEIKRLARMMDAMLGRA
ncbi:dihydropteroate synthase [Brevibacillus sp. SYP-B805]|uniref:dihydropteroate synthase n=1 Tax=Brevibacillus sp. SYP-B805 TaxID=1578199 RepID=UPI0013EC5510|nr:dihydropteroate synthase [Brevibacillus sp. SYP-B805]NGQ96404.1 dihydropteroate synthase [Brevibacillus sp. SYP-B805]